jgi:hypothetical protein
VHRPLDKFSSLLDHAYAVKRGPPMLDEKTIKVLFGIILGAWASDGNGEFISAKDFYTAARMSGFDIPGADPERRAPTLKAIDKAFGMMTTDRQYHSLVEMTARLVERGPQRSAQVVLELGKFGLSWDGENIVPVGVLDQRERQFLPPNSAEELSKAVGRLAIGDESGAISSACGAVDLATGAVYEKHGIGDPGKASFSAKVNTAAQKLGTFTGMKAEFVDIGMGEEDAAEASGHLEAAINHAGQALQILRKRMGDVHGSRPALKSTAYDCIKFASAICALFEGKV